MGATLRNVRHPGFVGRRENIPTLLNARSLTGIGAEIGVQRGEYSEVLLAGSRLTQLLLVDPWREFESPDYQDVANVSQREHDERFAEAQQCVSRFGSRAVFHRLPSLEAAPLVADGTLDFVYLDGRHDYASVVADLEAWYPKLTASGVIAGHDYVDADVPTGVFGVRSAVDEFFAARGRPVYDTFLDRPWSSWLVAPTTSDSRAVRAARSGLWRAYRARRKALRWFGRGT
jgi:hypothetical protein